MLIAVISDSHSRYDRIAWAVQRLREVEPAHVFHCGDIVDLRAAEMFHSLPMSFVFGNGDHDKQQLQQAIERSGNRSCGWFGETTLAGKKIGFTHGHRPALLRQAEQSGDYDFLFYGHSHRAEQRRSGKTLLLNPGALHRVRTKSFALVELESGNWETVLVPEQPSSH